MGRLVNLWKISDTPEQVIYHYGPAKEQSGRLSINKKTGEIQGEHIPKMDAQESWFFYGMLAKAKAEILFTKKEYPDETFMAT